MKFNPSQVMRTAKSLYQDETDPAEAIVKAIEFLSSISSSDDPNSLDNPGSPSAFSDTVTIPMPTVPAKELIEQLTNIVTNKKVHITAAAKGVGVHPVTLRSWIQGDSSPRPDKLAALQSFLANLNL
jgi:hypothetical protein